MILSLPEACRRSRALNASVLVYNGRNLTIANWRHAVSEKPFWPSIQERALMPMRACVCVFVLRYFCVQEMERNWKDEFPRDSFRRFVARVRTLRPWPTATTSATSSASLAWTTRVNLESFRLQLPLLRSICSRKQHVFLPLHGGRATGLFLSGRAIALATARAAARTTT